MLRTPYGVLVCSKELVKEVFNNRERHYTVRGYAERMQRILRRDLSGQGRWRVATSSYCTDSCPANQAIMSVTFEDAFESAFEQTRKPLNYLVADGARQDWR